MRNSRFIAMLSGRCSAGNLVFLESCANDLYTLAAWVQSNARHLSSPSVVLCERLVHVGMFGRRYYGGLVVVDSQRLWEPWRDFPCSGRPLL